MAADPSVAHTDTPLVSSGGWPFDPSFIALYPAPQREGARLLILDRAHGTIEHRRFSGLAEALGPGDVLVMNDTRVFPARAVGMKERTGGRVEVLFVRETSPGIWEVLFRGRLKVGQRIRFKDGLVGEVIRAGGQCSLRIEGDGPLLERLDQIGQVPLPPYIARAVEPSDRERYQTVYARQPGSVAAPTAGLHFSERLLGELAARGVMLTWLTLHIGPATFRQDRGRTRMDPEYMEIAPATVHAVARARRVVAVGTSTARALETMGAGGEPVGSHREPTGSRPICGWTRLTIVPGHVFRVVGALVTNFHLPGSTPLRLTTAFAGEAFLRRAYVEAIQARYRLLSYGDAMLIT